MNDPSKWPKINKITLLPPKFVRQAGRSKIRRRIRRRDITKVKQPKGNNILTRWTIHTYKYYSIEGHNVMTYPKKKVEVEVDIGSSRRTTKKKETNEAGPSRTIIQPIPQTMPVIPQTPSQPAQLYPREVPSQTQVEPVIQAQVPKKPRKKTTLTMICSQPMANANSIVKKMRKTKWKSLFQGG
ncbi:hypothetical protein LIER_39901 [Lithospermum erythrorhizon]|uniref:Uncharacterized protein n=1 Tax=Lithospermum erythrorhizon TaxID=34254 RepID=A0AAV3QLT2_LITER